MESNFRGNYEVLLVNDGSTDKTLELSRKYADGKKIKILSYEKNMGKGYAIRQGMLSAKGDYAVFTDCDLAYGLDVIGKICEMFEKDSTADIIIGSRAKHKDGYAAYTFMRKTASKAFLWLLKTMCGLKQSDSQTGIKGFKNSAAKKIFGVCMINRWSFDFELLLWAKKFGCHIDELPVKIINHRESKINIFKDGFRMINDIMKIRKNIKKYKI